MRKHSFECLLAGTSEEAWEILRYQHVDLVVAAIKLPQFGGIHLIHRIEQFMPTTPVLLITGYEEAAEKALAMKLEIVGCLLKPLDKREFMMCVRGGLARSNAAAVEAAP